MANEIKTFKWQIFLSVLWLSSCFSGHFWVCEANQANPQNPGFGLGFQAPTDYALASQRFNFAVDTSYRIGKLAEGNPDGLYVKYFSLLQISGKLSAEKICPNYDYIVSSHPEWILRKTDGSFFPGFQPGSYLMDIGNQSYVNYAINFIKNTGFPDTGGTFPGFSLDNGIFGYAPYQNSKYSTAAWQDAWENLTHELSDTFRPQYKIILNENGSDLAAYAKVVQWLDGTTVENMYAISAEGNYAKMRAEILGRFEKAAWAADHAKSYILQNYASLDAISVTPAAGVKTRYLTVTDTNITVLNGYERTIGSIDLSNSATDTVAEVANALKNYGLTVTKETIYSETTAKGAFSSLNNIKFASGTSLTVKLKQSPEEAFLFGYAVTLMEGDKNAYFVLGDERHKDYYYPEMDWDLGMVLGGMKQIAPYVYERDFSNYTIYLNISDNPYILPNSDELLPMRGAILETEKVTKYDCYTFRYYYGNGDYYTGVVYASPTYGYYTGWKKTMTNETANTGYYEIISMDYLGINSSSYGKVFVGTTYFDSDTAKFYKPIDTVNNLVGTNYLGSESGYIITPGSSSSFFGYGYYEANVINY
jgi:hypothetical protein